MPNGQVTESADGQLKHIILGEGEVNHTKPWTNN